MPVNAARFRSVVVDVDSTLCGVEGVDWLAQLRGPDVARESARLTEQAMNGVIPIDAIYGERLSLIRPTRSEVEDLSRVYVARIAVGAEEAIADLKKADIRVVLVSGGFRQAIDPIARKLQVELHAVDLHFDDQGNYAGFDERSPLTTQVGKLAVLRMLGLPRPTLALGDGSTDLGMRPLVDEFAAYTGFVRRQNVVAAADREITTYSELGRIVFSTQPSTGS